MSDATSVSAMELVELTELTDQDWADLVAGEQEPFGPIGAGLEWREKDRLLALRSPDGRLMAAAGAVLATVEVKDTESFEVVGLGGLIITRSIRGRGLMTRLVEPLLDVAADMGPERAMIFCRPELVALYRRLSFAEIPATVWADQSDGRIEMPLPAMWRALRTAPAWPEGRVDVRGLPF